MEPLLIPIVAILMPLALVPTILVLKHRHKRREWEHRERIKAMELQMPVPRGFASVSTRGVAAIGAGVPIASVLAAFLTGVSWDPTTPDDIPLPVVAWGCAVLISGGALVTSLILAFMHARAAEKAESFAQVDYGKPVFDPDAFDVVGSRA
jgi:ABC-type Fe3+ transport system permease subunit